MRSDEPELYAALDAYMAYEHYQKYEALAQKLGVRALKTCVMSVLGLCQHADPVEYLRSELAKDKHLNTIPLRRWDAREGIVLMLIKKTGGGFHSMAQSCCVLKHVAKHHIAGLPPPPPAEDPRRTQ